MRDVQATHPYVVIAVETGYELVWQVARLHDLAIAGIGRQVVLDDGAVMDVPMRRQWADAKSAHHFADNIDEPGFETIEPLVWIEARP
jgi:hypothetical protein